MDMSINFREEGGALSSVLGNNLILIIAPLHYVGTLQSVVIVTFIVYLFHKSLWLNTATGCRTCQKTYIHKQLII
jgi:hypothetical protein